MMRKIILSILMVFLIQNIAGAKERQSNPENFEALKLKVLENIGKKRVAMNAFETCVKSALDKKDFKTCRKTHRQTMKSLHPKERGDRGNQERGNRGRNSERR
ncbi:MAG: hypothetical protein HOL15_02405 [Nitrospinaceae bacterium]|nr:hypothetical protein [Nitrospina sp.]MBT5375645.1 hypothetical protein [Nitrospinaceae bacterium]MBT5867695.1 hypothetical protein [Nitrospinaceae bacterium]MBT6345130.1 hypothetical protein [Nitrospina sp.]